MSSPRSERLAAAPVPAERGGRALTPLAGILLGAGAAALLASAVLGAIEPDRTLGAYLIAYSFFWTLAIGGLFFVLVQHVTRAAWGVVIRRLAEQMAWPLVLLAILFLPLALGADRLYPWLSPEADADPLLAAKAPYLSWIRFATTAAVLFGLWIALAFWLRRLSLAQDRTGDPDRSERLRRGAAPGLVLFALSLTVASFDWLMSLQPHWYSTIFGIYVFAGVGSATMAFLILASHALAGDPRMRGRLTREHDHDLGKLLFAFACFWAYIAFSQFMLIWYASIPVETRFYGLRLTEGWRPITLALAIGHFAVPFLLLLSRHVKRRPRWLVAAAGWMLLMHAVDLYWLVAPAIDPVRSAPRLVDGLVWIGVGAPFLGVYLLALDREALVPIGDPRLAESLAFENE